MDEKFNNDINFVFKPTWTINMIMLPICNELALTHSKLVYQRDLARGLSNQNIEEGVELQLLVHAEVRYPLLQYFCLLYRLWFFYAGSNHHYLSAYVLGCQLDHKNTLKTKPKPPSAIRIIIMEPNIASPSSGPTSFFPLLLLLFLLLTAVTFRSRLCQLRGKEIISGLLFLYIM